MNEKKEDEFGPGRPPWLEDVIGRLLKECDKGNVSMDRVGYSVIGLSLLEIDPCPMPIVSYFKDDVMFTWSSPKGTMSIIVDNKPGMYFVWLSRNGYVSKKWESATIDWARKMFVDLFITIDGRWNPKS